MSSIAKGEREALVTSASNFAALMLVLKVGRNRTRSLALTPQTAVESMVLGCDREGKKMVNAAARSFCAES